MASKHRSDLFFAGQITGVEGYVGNIGTGLLAGINVARAVRGDAPILPPTTMLGGAMPLHHSLRSGRFQPMKANFGILPELEDAPKGKRIAREPMPSAL